MTCRKQAHHFVSFSSARRLTVAYNLHLTRYISQKPVYFHITHWGYIKRRAHKHYVTRNTQTSHYQEPLVNSSWSKNTLFVYLYFMIHSIIPSTNTKVEGEIGETFFLSSDAFFPLLCSRKAIELGFRSRFSLTS